MNHRRHALTGLVVIVLLGMAAGALADHHEDETAIREAVLNYVNGIYEVKPNLIGKSVSPRVQKVGYALKTEGDGYREMWMTFDELKALAAHYNQDGEIDPATAKRDIVILDQLDQTAVVRLDAAWGIDFIQLARQGGKWMIMNVIWQTYPEE